MCPRFRFIVGMCLFVCPSTLLAQTSSTSGPGPVTPDGSPAVNVDPYQNLRNYTPPPNTNFPAPPRACSGDLATANQNTMDTYQAFVNAQKAGASQDIVAQAYNNYVQAKANLDCLRSGSR